LQIVEWLKMQDTVWRALAFPLTSDEFSNLLAFESAGTSHHQSTATPPGSTQMQMTTQQIGSLLTDGLTDVGQDPDPPEQKLPGPGQSAEKARGHQATALSGYVNDSKMRSLRLQGTEHRADRPDQLAAVVPPQVDERLGHLRLTSAPITVQIS